MVKSLKSNHPRDVRNEAFTGVGLSIAIHNSCNAGLHLVRRVGEVSLAPPAVAPDQERPDWERLLQMYSNDNVGLPFCCPTSVPPQAMIDGSLPGYCTCAWVDGVPAWSSASAPSSPVAMKTLSPIDASALKISDKAPGIDAGSELDPNSVPVIGSSYVGSSAHEIMKLLLTTVGACSIAPTGGCKTRLRNVYCQEVPVLFGFSLLGC